MKGLVIDGLAYRDNGPYHLSVPNGECVMLAGPSGAGKSLFLRAVADMDVHEGDVRLNGISSRDMSGHLWRRKAGLLPAESAWWFESVGDHFTDAARIEERFLNGFGFSRDVMDWPVSRLSSGERQRLGILRLLDRKPSVLLLDEPTANLDGENRKRTENVIDAYRAKHKAPVLWVSHDESRETDRTVRWVRLEKNRLIMPERDS